MVRLARMSLLSRSLGPCFCGADRAQHFLRFSRLPLRVVQAFACLAQVQLAQTRLRFLDAADCEVQPLTHFAQTFKLRIFARRRCKPDCAHSRNLAAQFSLGNDAEAKNVMNRYALPLQRVLDELLWHDRQNS